MTQTTSLLINQIREKCHRAGWYGGWDFRPSSHRAVGSPTSAFAELKASEQQLADAEAIIGFTLPPTLRSLFGELANGGFGPGSGLRGVVGGYGTVNTYLPNGQFFRNDETITKFHAGGIQFVDVTFSQWQRILVPYDVWPKQLIPLCDMGDQVEVCIDQWGHLFYWGPSEDEGVYQFTDQGISLDQWIERWIES